MSIDGETEVCIEVETDSEHSLLDFLPTRNSEEAHRHATAQSVRPFEAALLCCSGEALAVAFQPGAGHPKVVPVFAPALPKGPSPPLLLQRVRDGVRMQHLLH